MLKEGKPRILFTNIGFLRTSSSGTQLLKYKYNLYFFCHSGFLANSLSKFKVILPIPQRDLGSSKFSHSIPILTIDIIHYLIYCIFTKVSLTRGHMATELVRRIRGTRTELGKKVRGE